MGTVLTLTGAFGAVDPTSLLGGSVTNGQTVVAVEYPFYRIGWWADMGWLTSSILGAGAQALDSALGGVTPPITVLGYDLGAVVASTWLANQASKSTIAPGDLSFVLCGNSMRAVGGFGYMKSTAAEVTSYSVPAGTPYSVQDIAIQYDGWCDYPNSPNAHAADMLLATANAIAGAATLHGTYAHVNPTDPANLVDQAGNITYILIPTQMLPLVKTTVLGNAAQIAKNTSERPLVESCYNRTMFTTTVGTVAATSKTFEGYSPPPATIATPGGANSGVDTSGSQGDNTPVGPVLAQSLVTADRRIWTALDGTAPGGVGDNSTEWTYTPPPPSSTATSPDVATGGNVTSASAPTATFEGSGTYPLPSWWREGIDYLDIVALGGGGGGGGFGNFLSGGGGGAPQWSQQTFQKLNSTTLNVTVGSGGAGSLTSDGGNGGTSSVSCGGVTLITAAGGTGGKYGGAHNTDQGAGASPGNSNYNNVSYAGGAVQKMPLVGEGHAGNYPGGGGTGAPDPFTTGGSGAMGKVWITPRQNTTGSGAEPQGGTSGTP